MDSRPREPDRPLPGPQARGECRRPSLRVLIALTLGALGLGTIPTKAVAQPMNCGPRDQVVRQLEGEFGETSVAMGIAQNGAGIFEIFASEGGASFTLIISLPNGQSCLVGTGTDWQFVFMLKGSES